MSNPFDGLREQLLAAGVAPRHVRRYLAELDDHLADLRDEAPCNEADAWAWARLGSTEALAGAMIAREELRGWDVRAPWAAYLLAPVLALVAGLALTVGLVYVSVESFRAPGGMLVLPFRSAEWMRSITAIGTGLLPILLGWGMALAANGRRRPPLWPALGVIALGILGGAIAFSLSLPTGPGEFGELAIEFALLPPFPGLGLAMLHIAANLALMLLPFAAWRHRRAAIMG
jgi:hypothetical protein